MQPIVTTVYSVTVSNDFGCTASDDIEVIIESNFDVFLPNAFSPNNDSINEVFMIYAGEMVAEIKSLQIYDRWGENVFRAQNFQANDPNFGWNGQFKNRQMSPAVFVYWAEVVLLDGQSEIVEGDVLLLR